MTWSLRLVWATLPFSVGPALAHMFSASSRAVQIVGTTGLWLGWIVVLTALLVPTTVSLTIIRLVVPGCVVAVVAAARHHAGGVDLALAFAASFIAVALAFSAEVGATFVQGSAYGDETRFPLRPPGPLVIGPLPLGWAMTFGAVVCGPLLLAARSWVLGAVVSVIGVGLSVPFGRRCHRLVRRFLVVVPAGIVVHDHFVLADTSMFGKSDVASLRLAPSTTEAADLTGKALGNAVEIALKDFETVVMAGTLKNPGGTALHARSVLVSPSRPGRFLAEVARRGHRVL